MRTSLVLACLVALSTPCVAQQPESALSPDAMTEADLRATRAALEGALARGDRGALEEILAAGFMFVHTTGVVETRDEYINRAVAGAGAGAAPRPHFAFDDERIRVYGGTTVVWTARAVRQISGTPDIRMRSTDVLVKQEGRWRWASVHSTRLPTRPAPAAVSPAALQALAGEYEIAPGRAFTVIHENGVLRGSAAGVRQSELIPRSETEFVWFSPESNADMVIVFQRGEDGQTHAVLRREGVDAWRARKVR